MVVSILLYGCETWLSPSCSTDVRLWTMLADDERRIQAFETKCLRKLLRISYREHNTNDYVRSLVKNLVDPREPPPGNRQATEAGVVWPRHEARHPPQTHHARYRRWRTETRETATEPVPQRQGLAGDDLPRPLVDGRQQNSFEEDVCFFCPSCPLDDCTSRGTE